ncbi:MAG: hypothetical protein KDD66_17925, partial [Bdellovibrionales bacterium]|nr:hypothetical protein [Bdellovibrionales bacterium]
MKNRTTIAVFLVALLACSSTPDALANNWKHEKSHNLKKIFSNDSFGSLSNDDNNKLEVKKVITDREAGVLHIYGSNFSDKKGKKELNVSLGDEALELLSNDGSHAQASLPTEILTGSYLLKVELG